MKEPIEPSDIRAGDLIRVENKSASGRGETAHEFRASIAADTDGWVRDRFNWFLLDRPKPAVVLPTEPTLGWLTRYLGEESSGLGRTRTHLGTFHNERATELAFEVDSLGAHVDSYSEITTFTPATAVPTEALKKLREVQGRCDATYPDYQLAITSFLDAVDAANGAAS